VAIEILPQTAKN